MGTPVRTGASQDLRALEAGVAISTALIFVGLCRSIDVNPLDRLGQISGLAALQVRFALVATVPLVLAALGQRSSRPAVVRAITCGLAAGLTTAVVAGGVAVALSGTPWGLFAKIGDAGRLADWAEATVAGTSGRDPAYPPLYLWIMGLYARLRDIPTGYAAKDVSILLTALTGPLAYVAWRTLQSPLRALCITVVTCAMFVDPYKPHTVLALVVIPPLFVHVLKRLDAPRLGRVIAARAAFDGIALGVVFLLYSGWFVWALPGLAMAVLAHRPWRERFRPLVPIASTAGGFVVVAGVHLLDVLRASSVADGYVYFDVRVDPAYIAMFRGDLPGVTGPWPPPGEVGGVGTFMVLLIVGVAMSLWLCGSHVTVRTMGLIAAGAWVVRMVLAARMYESGNVQLYPRTTSAVLIALVIIAMHGVFALFDRLRAGRSDLIELRHDLAATFAVLALAALAGSATADRFQPVEGNSVGALAYQSHITPLEGGGCPTYAPVDRCDG